jgi:hypothetical protein
VTAVRAAAVLEMTMRSCRSVPIAFLALAFPALATMASVRAADDWVVGESGAEDRGQSGADASRYDLGENFDVNLALEDGIALHGPNQVKTVGLALTLGNGARLQIANGDGSLTLVGGPIPKDAAGQQPELATVARLRQVADARLATMQAAVRLPVAEWRRLKMAMESDVNRVANEIDDVRRSYQGVEVGIGDEKSQKTLRQYREDLGRCRKSLRHPFGEGSLFSKVFAGIEGNAAGR